MATLNVVDNLPQPTISGVTQANPGTISGVTQANPGTISGVSQTPVSGSSNYNPQEAAFGGGGTVGIQAQSSNLQTTANPQPQNANPQGASGLPQTGQTFQLADGSSYNANGQQLTYPTPSPTAQSMANMQIGDGTVVNSSGQVQSPPPSPSQQAFNQVKNTPPPQTQPDAAGTVKTAIDQHTPIDNAKQVTMVKNTLDNYPGYQTLLKDVAAAKNSATQSQTLEQHFSDLMKQFDVPGINLKMMNDQKIINGTIDDIGHEVQAAHGFATTSQILALANARNKSVIQDYNTLQQQKSDALSTINTMVGLAGQDRAFAQQVAMQQLQIDQQVNDYAQKFQANAQEAYKNVISAVGYAGLFKALQSDPASVSLAEQTLGLGPGSLQNIASIPNPDAQLKAVQLAQAQLNLQQDITNGPLDIAAKQAQIKASQASAASSSTNAAQNAYDLQFEKQYGMTPNQYAQTQISQQKDLQSQFQAFNTDAGKQTELLANHKTTWGAAWNLLHATYPDASTQKIDDALMSNLYRNSQYGG